METFSIEDLVLWTFGQVSKLYNYVTGEIAEVLGDSPMLDTDHGEPVILSSLPPQAVASLLTSHVVERDGTPFLCSGSSDVGVALAEAKKQHRCKGFHAAVDPRSGISEFESEVYFFSAPPSNGTVYWVIPSITDAIGLTTGRKLRTQRFIESRREFIQEAFSVVNDGVEAEHIIANIRSRDAKRKAAGDNDVPADDLFSGSGSFLVSSFGCFAVLASYASGFPKPRSTFQGPVTHDQLCKRSKAVLEVPPPHPPKYNHLISKIWFYMCLHFNTNKQIQLCKYFSQHFLCIKSNRSGTQNKHYLQNSKYVANTINNPSTSITITSSRVEPPCTILSL